MKGKLVITGASGFLGWHLIRLAIKEWEVYGISNSHPITGSAVTAIKCDIANYIELGDVLNDIEPDALIHTAAIADANFCEQNKELSYAVNVEASVNLAGICSDFSIPMAFTSTDLVFDGKKGMYVETDAKNPLSVYGEHKSAAEEEVLRIYPEACVFRLPFMLGHPDAGVYNYLRKFIAQLRQGEDIRLFTNEYRSVAGARSVSYGILALFEANAGVIHLGGSERLSRYEAGVKIAKALQLPEQALKACVQADVAMAAPRPPDVSMDISKAVRLGYEPLLLDKELNLMATNDYM